jgi:hypothetical protein
MPCEREYRIETQLVVRESTSGPPTASPRRALKRNTVMR